MDLDHALRLIQQSDGHVIARIDRDQRGQATKKGTQASQTHNQSFGIQFTARVGHGTAHAHTDDPDPAGWQVLIDDALRHAKSNDARMRHQGTTGTPPLQDGLPTGPTSVAALTINGHPLDDPQAAAELAAVSHDAAIERMGGGTAIAALGWRQRTTTLLDATGTSRTWDNFLSTLIVQTVTKDGGSIGNGQAHFGAPIGTHDYGSARTHGRGDPEALGTSAADNALEELRARAAPAGHHRIACDSHLTGLMVHESFGHLTEADLIEPGWSVLAGKNGQRLAADGLTIRDAPSLDNQGVHAPVDHEGTPGRTATLVDDGHLVGHLHRQETATRAEVEATGNCFSLGIAQRPIVRMRNTYMEGGDLKDLDEALELLGDGYYFLGARGGSPQADGSFHFGSQRGYEVKGGEIQRPVKMASIRGNVLELLRGIEGMTRDIQVDANHFAGCEKWDQGYLPVGTGGPAIVVDRCQVGGQA